MKPPVVIIGIDELGGVFARGFLRLGRSVHPVTRALAEGERLGLELPALRELQATSA